VQTNWNLILSDDILDHLPALRSFARALCSGREEAEDLVQETLLRAIEYSASYRKGTNMRGWLCTIMRNRFYTNIKKRRRENTGAEDCASGSVVTPGTQEWHIQGCELSKALHELPLHYREAVVFVLVMGESYIEASRLMQCDVGTIKSRVNRGRNMLKAKLGVLQ
jgi:RNA polymerase sigma-70 factor (ECF subfamily)